MALHVACPKCDFVLERATNESPPSHCPACGSRVACPRCGSTLARNPMNTAVIHCSQCHVDLDGAETGLMDQTPLAVSAFPVALPGFELRGEVGRGGMAIVYRAYQHSLKREVALKVLPPALACNSHLMSRFQNEASLAAGLVDSHILPVFDVQDIHGVPVIIMPLIEGRDLGRILRDRLALKQGKPPDDRHPWALLGDREFLDRVLPILDQVVAAVTALHRAGILHRDIKPSNILVDDKGSAWLGDFGLARLQEVGVGTMPGFGMGTPGYISPEQARGDKDIDFRCDVFGLGATIYQALTLELPYGKMGAREHSPLPRPPRRRQPLAPRDVDAVVLKALDPNPAGRYATAEEFQEDWIRVREGLLPRARLANFGQRLLWKARRHPVEILGGLAISLLAVSLLVLTLLPRGNGNSPEPPLPSDPPAPVTRTVHVETEPANAQVALVPLNPDNGFPMEDNIIRPPERTPLVIKDVPVGEYLVVAEVAGHGFHEVYRTVPRMGQTLGERQSWDDLPGDEVKLLKIKIPTKDVTKGMAYFKGGSFTMGTNDLPDTPPHPKTVASFFLDTTEVTVGQFRAHFTPDPFKFHPNQKPPPDSYPMTYVTWDMATFFAETIGKRLMSHAEYEFAATNGGTTKFPWGDLPGKMLEGWPFGPAGTPDFDKTNTTPPVFGLFSNAAEWTSSYPHLYPGAHPNVVLQWSSPEIQRHWQGTMIIRGGPYPVGEGSPNPRDAKHPWDTRAWYSGSRMTVKPGLGFRCARSESPPFLNP